MNTARRSTDRIDAWPWLTGGSLLLAVIRGTGVATAYDTVLTGAQFGCLALGLIVLWLTGNRLPLTRTHWLAFAFGGFGVASALWSPVPITTLSRSLLFLLVLLFVVETARNRWADTDRLAKDLLLLLWGAVVLSALGLLLGLFSVPGMWGDYYRFKGFTANATVAAWIATIAFPIGYARIFNVAGRERLWLIAGAAALGIAVLASGTRGALIALLGSVALVHVIRRSHWVTGAAVSMVVLLGSLLTLFGPKLVVPAAPVTGGAPAPVPSPSIAPAPIEVPIGRLVEPRTDISSGRFDLWETGFGLWVQRPIGGWGFGGTGALEGLTGTSLHNGYLSTLIETGIVGLVILLALLGSVFLWKTRPDAGIIAAGAAVLVNGFFESSLVNLGSPVTLIAWLAIGALLAAGQLSMKLDTYEPKRPALSRKA